MNRKAFQQDVEAWAESDITGVMVVVEGVCRIKRHTDLTRRHPNTGRLFAVDKVDGRKESNAKLKRGGGETRDDSYITES